MLSTTHDEIRATITEGRESRIYENELVDHYQDLLQSQRLFWTSHLQLGRCLGAGGQGVVFLSERRGADGFTLPVAVKILSPERYAEVRGYEEAMERMAKVSANVALIQHDNLLDVHNFVDRNRIRLMIMEWVDGYDLQRLLVRERLHRIEGRVSLKRWEYLNRVVVTDGPQRPRFKAGVAVSIVRDCLGALAALHRERIVHGDIKPSNIMLKRTGSAKIVDIGSAFSVTDPPARRTCTPTFAAPEVLEGNESTARSDLASIGYVLIELLAGRSPFAGITDYKELLAAKRTLPQRLHEILPPEVTVNELLMSFCRGLIAPDPMRRFPSAEVADFREGEGAAAFQRQLVLSDLASEYGNDLRLWLEELKELDELES